jgi:hypothetical protein
MADKADNGDPPLKNCPKEKPMADSLSPLDFPNGRQLRANGENRAPEGLSAVIARWQAAFSIGEGVTIDRLLAAAEQDPALKAALLVVAPPGATTPSPTC